MALSIICQQPPNFQSNLSRLHLESSFKFRYRARTPEDSQFGRVSLGRRTTGEHGDDVLDETATISQDLKS